MLRTNYLKIKITPLAFIMKYESTGLTLKIGKMYFITLMRPKFRIFKYLDKFKCFSSK